MRREKADKAERADRKNSSAALSALSALSVLSALSACARIEPPPGGPPDREPPRLISVRPDSLATLRGFDGVAEFQFDEVISEGGAPNRGEGTGGLEKLVILSPTTRVPQVDWRRSRITVKPSEGWRPNRVYRVELLPGVTDLRNNRSPEGAVVTFTTGAPPPRNRLSGLVVDWSTSRPAAGALVVAALLPDSLPYRGVADSTGRFSLGPLPAGEYLVTGVLDQNDNQLQDLREAYGSARVPEGRTDVGELWAFVHDTTPARIQTVTVEDSVSATIAFSQRLDPRQRFTPRDVRLRLLPDSTPVAITSLLPKPLDDSLHRRTPAAGRVPADTADTLARPDTIPRRGRARATPAPTSEPLTSRPPLFDRLVLRVPRPWAPGARLVIEIQGVRNVTGVAGNAVGVVAVPEKTAPPRAGPKPERGRGDTTSTRQRPAQPPIPTPTPK
ncbi:MAG TPA: Ig-like domain-containing protein [Gemmatimonadales bacterium]|nr:Ig-like domain-containing protein [Gemmatimonadales bacterium]